MYLLGYDIGTSSVKASVVDAKTGQTVASAQYPDAEAPITSKQAGWAEQEPEMWWDELKQATKRVAEKAGSLAEVAAIGISYQMHGLVCVDKEGAPLRPSIIWCDGRAVPYGNAAFDAIGGEKCLEHLLNSPGNFTAAKLAWVKENEPEIYAKIDFYDLCSDVEGQPTDIYKYDTILFLMNGSGIIGKVENISSFFKKVDLLLADGGCVYMDSSDIRYIFEDEDGSFEINLNGAYYGELEYQMQYKRIKGEPFSWLYLDFATLQHYSEENGFKAELVLEGEHYDYLACISRA